MTIKRLVLALALIAGLGGVAYVADKAEGPGTRMVRVADKLVAGLDADQKKRTLFGFDDRERTRWFFTPQQKGGKPTRKGLPLEAMSADQKARTMELVKAGTSKGGFDRAVAILELEGLLRELEKGRKSAPGRNPEWYFLTLFGTPGKGKWGWRLEGHHLSLNFTLEDDRVVAATPHVFAANPAIVKSGAKKGMRALPETEEPVRALLAALDADQKKAALRTRGFPEIGEGLAKPKAEPLVGVAGEKMNEKQRALLQGAIKAYLGRLAPELAAFEWRHIQEAGLDKVHFALSGDGTLGRPWTYRIQGPTFQIEFLNEQADSDRNPANHIHSGVRRTKGDFGLE